MLGILVLFLVVVLLVLGIIFGLLRINQPKSQKEPKRLIVEKAKRSKPSEKVKREENKEWFKEGRWLTDKEIDSAGERMEKDKRFKILPAHQFHLTKEAKRKDDALIFTQLLSEINDNSKELVFIPVNKGNYHWSLLVYEGKSKKFYHYDSLGGINDKYVEPLVRELLVHILPNADFSKYLVHKHHIRQNNGYDCGIAAIAITKRIIRLWNQNWLDWMKYGSFSLESDLGGFDFKKEREELRKEWLREQK